LSLRILELAASHFCAHFPFLSKFRDRVKQNRFSMLISPTSLVSRLPDHITAHALRKCRPKLNPRLEALYATPNF
jgi:hypothetical protein